MLSTADQQALTAAYQAEYSSGRGAVLRCGVGLAVVCAFAGLGSLVNPDAADIIQKTGADRGRLAVEAASVAHARDVYKQRKLAAAAARLNGRLMAAGT
jgi:hypothetical protein